MGEERNRLRLRDAAPMRLLALSVCLVLTPLRSHAGIILGQHDWDSTEGWSSLEGWTTVTDPAGGGWLNVSFPATSQPEAAQDEWYDTVYVSAEDLFAGTWTSDMFVEFDFWAEDVTPDAVQLQWSSSTNSDIWATALQQPSATQEWDRLTASFGDWTDWLFPGATEDQYLSDLSTIDWIGVYVYRDGAGAQDYRIDDVSLMVPEPAQLVMLASALATSLMAVRRRKRGDGGNPGSGGSIES